MTVTRIGAVVTAGLLILIGVAGVLGLADDALAVELRNWQYGSQEAVTPVARQMDSFHNLLLVVITAIMVLVTALLAWVLVRYNARVHPTPTRTTHNTLLEVAWTVVPVIILIVIAIPSMQLLYYQDRIPEAELTIKATGRQWYWDYEYPDQGITFSAMMVPSEEIKPGQQRLLETDNRVVVPVDTTVRVLLTGGDVIHSWAMPSFGIKKDAVPGRLNETWMRIEKEGVYYGQCSELCGTNHGFMPIAVEAVSKERFAQWVKESKTTAFRKIGPEEG